MANFCIFLCFHKTSLCWISFLLRQCDSRGAECCSVELCGVWSSALVLVPAAGRFWCGAVALGSVWSLTVGTQLSSARKLDLRPWILFPREEISCISCILLVNETHKHFTFLQSVVTAFVQEEIWLFPFLMVVGCSSYMSVKKIKDHRKVIWILYLKNEMTLG